MRAITKKKGKTTGKLSPGLFFRIVKKVPLPVYVFIFFALLSGAVFIRNTGSFSGPDLNAAHYRAALAVATGQSFAEPVKEDNGRIHLISGNERYFESGEGCIKNSLVAGVIEFPLISDGMNDCIGNHDKNLSVDDDVVIRARIQYPPLGYLPQAIGLAIGMETGQQPIRAQMIARFLNLLFYIIMIAASILILPRGKWLAAFIGLLPTSVFLASSLSSDAMNIAWSFLFTAYIIRLYLGKIVIGRKQMIALAILGVGLFLLKVAYAPLILLILALDRVQIKPKTKYLLFGSIFAIGSILYIVWSSSWSSLNAAVDVSNNLSAIVHNLPQAVLGIITNIIYIPMQMFTMPQTTYLAAAFVIFAAVIMYIKSVDLPKFTVSSMFSQYRLCLLGILAALGSLGLTYAALLLTWTDIGLYGWINIQGFQGRYVMPLLPLLLLVYGFPKNTKNSDNEK